MILKTIPIYYLALIAVLLFEYIHSGKIAETSTDIILHIFGMHALNFSYYNSLLPGGIYIGVLYVTWALYLFYCRFVDSKEKSIIGAFAVLLVGYELKNVILINNVNAANYSGIATVVLYYFRAFCSFAAGNLIYYLSKDKKQEDNVRKTYISIATVILIIVIIVFCKDDYIRDEQFILLISVMIYLNIPNSSKIIDNKIFSTVGTYCFEIYLVHVSLFAILPSLMAPGLLQLLVMTVLTASISWFLHKFITLKVTPHFVDFMLIHHHKVN